MASPNVAGSLILLQEHYKNENSENFMLSPTLKALVVTTANDAGPTQGPDYASGWGLLNAYKAVSAISANGKYAKIIEETLNNNETKSLSVIASGSEPLKVTIAWLDPVGTDDMMPSDALNDRKVTLVNDLDIKITKDGETYLPWVLNPEQPTLAATKGNNIVDNIEQVVIESPEAGATYTIEISHKNTLKKNAFSGAGDNLTISLVDADSQNYSMVATGVNEGVNVDLALDKIEVTKDPIEYTNATPVNFTVVNKGLQTITDGKLVYKLVKKEGNEVINTEEVVLSPMNAGEEVVITANIDLSTSFVDFVIQGKVEVPNDEFVINNEDEVEVYGYLADLRPEDTSYFYSFENSPSKEGWRTEDKDGNGNTWSKFTDESFAKTGTDFALDFINSGSGNYNDWLYTNPIYVKANTKYRIVYNARKFQGTEEKIAVYLGDQANSAAMTTQLGEEVISLEGTLDKNFTKYFYEFETTEDKIIYIGFNNKIPGGKPSFAVGIDNVTIERAAGAPVVEFVADKLNTTSYDVVTFNSTIVAPSDDPVTSYNWEFNPNTVSFEEGTSASSETPKVTFNNEGVYSVTLKASNGAGEGMTERADYIEITNQTTEAMFVASNTSVLQGETVTFTNTSTGDPMPTEFEWSITPEDGVELITANTDKDLIAKFNEPGSFTISLKAVSLNNEDTYTANDLVKVGSLRPPVQNLTGDLDQSTKEVALDWDKPIQLPIYLERFLSEEELPADLVYYDGNEDGAS